MTNKYELIQQIINSLNTINVSGYKNLTALVGSINALKNLAEVLNAEDVENTKKEEVANADDQE